ncbi:MAG: hypothetical protein KAI24_03840 [Planctomycetes bacterium]|nr:hypothetical protein [Planctomycetota bacterium]
MISRYHPRHAGRASDLPPPPSSSEDGASTSERTKQSFAELLSAGRDAARHGSAVAKVRMWRAQDAVRRGIARLVLAVFAGVAALSAVAALAIWGTINLLSGLTVAMGGGLLGTALALVTFVAVAAAVGAMARWIGQRRKNERRRRRLQPSGALPEDDAEHDELDELEAQAMADLQKDKERLLAAGEQLVRDHPVAGVGVGAATGYLAGRTLASGSQTGRRAAAQVWRLARTAGISAAVQAASGALGGAEESAAG